MRTQQVQAAQLLEQRVRRRKMKRRFKLRFLFTGPDLLRRASSADEQRNGINEQRFPCAGFAGEHRETGLKLNVQLFYERKVDNAQLGKHRGE
jgi:hypothetical protein